jgi:hypothetical protein
MESELMTEWNRRRSGHSRPIVQSFNRAAACDWRFEAGFAPHLNLNISHLHLHGTSKFVRYKPGLHVLSGNIYKYLLPLLFILPSSFILHRPDIRHRTSCIVHPLLRAYFVPTHPTWTLIFLSTACAHDTARPRNSSRNSSILTLFLSGSP